MEQLVSTLGPALGGRRAQHTVVLDDEAIVQVRLTLSPHCTTLASLVESSPDTGWSGSVNGWGRVVEQRRGDFDLRELAAYTCEHGFPAALTSALRSAAPTFESQVEEIRAIPDERIVSEVRAMFPGEVPEPYATFVATPRDAINRLCTALLVYWRRVVEPSWPSIRPFLEREIIKQSYALATQAPTSALNDVHPAIAVEGANLYLTNNDDSESSPLDGRILMLTPLLSGREGIFADLRGPTHVKIGYAAAGAESVWVEEVEDAVSGLDELLGESRARILRQLRVPTTTTDLSAAHNLAPATVSAHLAVLNRLGLVDRDRNGRWVTYQTNEAGDSLIALFDTIGVNR